MVAATVPCVTDSYHVESPHLGASKIATYLKCPRMYELTYVLKVPAPKSVYAALGTCIHAVVRQAHAARWQPEDAAKAEASLRALWEQTRPETDDPDNPEVAQSLEKACLQWLPWYLHFIGPQIDVCVEERWQLELCGITLEGTIDRVYRQDGEVILSDVKSGARKPSQADLDNDLQLSIYSYAVRELGIAEDAAELVWLRTQERLRTTRTDEYLRAVMQQTVLPVARAIEAGIYPAHTQSKYGCNFCSYTAICDVGRGCKGER
jgi:RecB family exonuclease